MGCGSALRVHDARSAALGDDIIGDVGDGRGRHDDGVQRCLRGRSDRGARDRPIRLRMGAVGRILFVL
eukprot:7277878-Prymnesium_polylepis.1